MNKPESSIWLTLQFGLMASTIFILITGGWMMGLGNAPWLAVGLLVVFTAIFSLPIQIIFWILLNSMPAAMPLQKKLQFIRLYLLVVALLSAGLLSFSLGVPFLFPSYRTDALYQALLLFVFLGSAFELTFRWMTNKLIRLYQYPPYEAPAEVDSSETLYSITHKINSTMETSPLQPTASPQGSILIKGLTTGGLILLMLIPTIFITHLIEERETRHKEVVQEVSARWANPQTIASPYLLVPYTETFLNHEGKQVQHTQHL
ncbi:MAG TPA: hypothetical protein DEU93_03870, partial [Chitinophagaceae bacterium]|nr:hypothetical protein [Chitinophagaceae bacterium]HML57553.1 inner membrane CreD family protein [Ferruginibacter sp.]